MSSRSSCTAWGPALNGSSVHGKLSEAGPSSIIGRLFGVVYGHWRTTQGPTQNPTDQPSPGSGRFESAPARAGCSDQSESSAHRGTPDQRWRALDSFAVSSVQMKSSI